AGQPVALVLAETPETARAAAAAVEVRYAPTPAITALDQAREAAFAPRTAGLTATDSRRGEPEAALAAAAVTLDRRYTTPTHNHLAIEPQVVLAEWDGSQLTVHTPSQAVFAHRTGLAKCFGLDVAHVRVISSYLGGGFGSKGGAWFPCLELACLAARQLGRPVRLELARAQMFTLVGRRQETVQRLQIGAARDGRIDALLHDTVAQTSTYGEYADPVATPTRMMYACANVATTHRLVRVNAPQPNPARAPGEGPGSFALESALDELAHKLDLDPIELRRRNFADRDQHAGLPWSSNGLLECYRVGTEAFGWARRPRTPGTLRDGRHRLGWGMAAACYPAYRIASQAAVGIGADGRVNVRCGTQDMGSGTYTVLAQLAAEALGVPYASVDVALGDTLLPEGPYSGGSMATASFTPAIEDAARQLRADLIARAVADPHSPLHGQQPDQVGVEAGVMRAGNRSESLADLLARVAPQGLEATTAAAPNAKPTKSFYGFGAVFAEVRVDPDFGEVRVTRLSSAYATGRILNPLLARSQFVGGLVWGIGMALHEQTVMDKNLGRIVNDNLADYLIPVHADMPRFDIHMLPDDEPHLGSGGVKGIGMLGTCGTAAAIANAVFHATGRRIRDLPIRLEQLL
ncbi:MAG TPA: xanthine dehydrogenase family protein molybdopterin-binding subunit, partial [Reyranella sp.]|nr:xanthine dehydrogenase family protein molybdopterin-binding subunit [Reyranella sp.]